MGEDRGSAETPLAKLFYDGEGLPNLPNLPGRKTADNIAGGCQGIKKAARNHCRTAITFSANPVAGPIFANSVGNPLSLGSMVNPVILPSLNRCETCGKKDSDHQKTVHRLQT